MLRANSINFKGTKEYQAEAAQSVVRPGDVALVVRGLPRSLVMACPDGCGETITINLDERSGPAWRVFERAGKLTLYPSVWRETGCRAHFILWRNKLVWCDWEEEPAWEDKEFQRAVLAALPEKDYPPAHFEDLAASLKSAPWDTLWMCRSLVRRGLAVAYSKATRFTRSGRAEREGNDGG